MFRIASIAFCVALTADQVNAVSRGEARERMRERRYNRKIQKYAVSGDLAQLSSENESTHLG